MYRLLENIEGGEEWASPQAKVCGASTRGGPHPSPGASFERGISRICAGRREEYLEAFCFFEKSLTWIVAASEPEIASGPMAEYDERVHSHRLRDDEHQRGVKTLQPMPQAHLTRIQALSRTSKICMKCSCHTPNRQFNIPPSHRYNRPRKASSPSCPPRSLRHLSYLLYQSRCLREYTCTAMWDPERP